MTESKTAGCKMATPADKSSKGTNQIVSKIQRREARSKHSWGKSEWLSLFVPPFVILDQCSDFI
jgi:hypothetical protein